MSKRPAHERDEQILDLLDGSLPEAKQAELRAWLDQSPAHWDRFAELSFIHSQIASQLHSQRSSTDLRLDALQAVAPHDELPPIHLDATVLTKEKYLSALTYVLKHTFTPKRVAILASAAAVLLGVVLAIVMMSGPGTPEQIVEQPLQSSEKPTPALPTQPAVATLTATHNAQWSDQSAERVLAPGSALKAGSRLNLTAGFVEITTNRGAVIILQAPCTVELLDNANALRLHAGKLVGICETDASKGFLVRTPHMDITDLGTRFGVQANDDATEVHVFQGEVQAAKVDAASDAELTLLDANQSARMSADTDTITRIDYNEQIFTAMLPQTWPLPGTGVGLKVGDAAPAWHIIAINCEPMDQPQALRVANNQTYIQHFPNDPETSQWLGWDPQDEPAPGEFNTYTFQTSFELPEQAEAARTTLRLRYMADNSVSAIDINDKPIDVAEPAYSVTYDEWQELTIAEHLVPGTNWVRIQVRNFRSDINRSADQVGLRLTWQIETNPPFTPLQGE